MSKKGRIVNIGTQKNIRKPQIKKNKIFLKKNVLSVFFLSVICEIPPWRLTLRHLAPYSALCCGVLADSHNSAPFKNVQFEPPQKPAAAGDVRVTQVEIPSLLGCSISLACDPHTHTGEEGIRPPLPPSPPVLCRASFHPSCPPLCSGVWCTARGCGPNSVKPAR